MEHPRLVFHIDVNSAFLSWESVYRLKHDPAALDLRTSRICEDSYVQMELFETEQSCKMKKMEKAVDAIRSKYGVDSIQRASFLKSNTVVDHAVGKEKHLNQKGQP